MSHQIEEYDVTYSTIGTEWHGLAVVEPDTVKLLSEVKTHLCMPIVECEAVVNFEGASVPLKTEDGQGWKVVCADCRALPVHSARRVHPPALVPLGIPKMGYETLPSLRFLECLETAMAKLGLPFNLSTAGTLANMALFYFSIDLGRELKGGRGETLKPYLAGLTSHNGTIRPQFRDCSIRPVCRNTVNALMQELVNLLILGKHTTNGLSSIENMGEAVELFFTGCDRLESEVFPRLQSDGMDSMAMRETMAGYFLLPAMEGDKKLDLDKVKLSRQAQNAMEGIVDLARTGQGNFGETRYDLWNGATDYWSNGNGVGSDTVGKSKKAYRSNFGSASNHKADFSSYLFDDEKVSLGRAAGKRVLMNMAIAE